MPIHQTKDYKIERMTRMQKNRFTIGTVIDISGWPAITIVVGTLLYSGYKLILLTIAIINHRVVDPYQYALWFLLFLIILFRILSAKKTNLKG